MKPVRLEKNDTFSVSADKHVISFVFKNYGFIDGLNFYTRCAPSITFSFQSDGKPSPPHNIVIGRKLDPPADEPVHHQPGVAADHDDRGSQRLTLRARSDGGPPDEV